MKTYLCACNGAACEGICKETHLFRKRQTLEICPAAYSKKERKNEFEEDDKRLEKEKRESRRLKRKVRKQKKTNDKGGW